MGVSFNDYDVDVTAMDGADVVLFTGGIAENSSLRSKVCSGLKFLGIEIDEAANESKFNGAEGLISSKNSKVKVFVVATNEELMIARDTLELANE